MPPILVRWFGGVSPPSLAGICCLLAVFCGPVYAAAGGDLEADTRPSDKSDAIRVVDPRTFGLAVPAGPVAPGENRRVSTHDEEGRPVVGKLHARVGDHWIVLLPDGQLVGRAVEQVTATNRRFVAATLDELAEQLTSTTFRGFRTKRTRHYLYVFNTSDAFALATSRILESMIPGMSAHAKSQRIDVHPPEVPLIAIMFQTEQEFQQYRRMPEGVVAYYHALTNRIVMHEDSRLARIKPSLAIEQSISNIAHEGAHQILHNIGVQARLSVWPTWLSEGLAEYYAPTSFGKRLRWKGAGQVNDLRMFELELYLKGRRNNPPDGQLIAQTVKAARLTSTGYASAWSLTHFLAKTRRRDFNRYVHEVSRLGPFEVYGDASPPGVVPANLDLFSKHFGGDLADLEQHLVGHLSSLPYHDPFAQWPHYVATVTLPEGSHSGRDANLFHTPGLARRWIAERRESVEDARRNEVRSQIRTFPNRVLAEQFARQWVGQQR